MSKLRLHCKETVYNADDLKMRIAACLVPGTTTTLDTSELETADLTCLQTLVAAHRAASHVGSTLVADDSAGSPLARAFARAGIAMPFEAAPIH